VAIGRRGLDHHIAAFDEAGFGQTLLEHPEQVSNRRADAEISDHRHGCLLRARCERPSGHRAAEQRYELATSHVGHGGLPGRSLLHSQPATTRPVSPWANLNCPESMSPDPEVHSVIS
jgi:hypothetical protein